MNISFSKSAVKDLEQIKEYYLEQGVPHIGIDFVTTIVEHVETLSKHPDIGRMVPEFNDELIRELIHVPFRVVYLRESTSIKVIRVWRSERILHLPK
ncbi:type II toxin-antitoxin system RelE/ParE family toxin [Aliiglaciecola sp. LCG003]|uniref:type II toxin-antitoxin system RelE/ParE family toxin n=1 Tax=Aliiglaciecola sp. LCG003 TaxID=3053655 RepID=UPI002573AF43|nr:type II toxin-antitoxin system RelE/ParE family toxin [Aliiglaciecola sp. LCG003]WJG10926.1 type II toxin-antitoxin system RelE/ParE family toxin [Aliiglaciecola sp. LCG003]